MQHGSLRVAEFALPMHLFSPVGESLSVACPTESNQRRRHPAITAFDFLALLNKIRRSRNSTWQLTYYVSCCGIQTVAPSTLILPPLLSVMEWELSRPNRIVEVWTVKTQILFLNAQAVASSWCLGSPSAAPSNAGLAGVFGHRLFEFRGGLRFVQATRASFDGRPLC